jgi:hypothetical protein
VSRKQAMIMRIFGACCAALFSIIIFGLEMSIATTGSGGDPSTGIARKGDRLVPAAKKAPDISAPSVPASSPALYEGCEFLVSSLALLPSGRIAVRCLS